MAELKTKATTESVENFLNTIEDPQRKADSFDLLEIMKQITGEDPIMWGPAIVGFGKYTYKYSDGKEADWPLIAFSPRKQNLTLYLMQNFTSKTELLSKLGKHSTSKACLYIKKLSDVDRKVLLQLLEESFMEARKTLT